MPCPITVAYLKRVRQTFEQKNSTLYEDLFNALDELRDQAERSTPSDAVVRLRAFRALRHMNEVLAELINMSRRSSFSVTSNEFDHSWAGLCCLLERINQLERQLVIEDTESRMDHPATIQSMTNWMRERSMNQIAIYRKAAELLRRELRDPIKDIHRVGTYLGEFMEVSGKADDRMLSVGRTIISIYL